MPFRGPETSSYLIFSITARDTQGNFGTLDCPWVRSTKNSFMS